MANGIRKKTSPEYAIRIATCLICLIYSEGKNPVTIRGSIWGGVNFSQVDGDTYAGYHKAGIAAGIGGWIYWTDSWWTHVSIGYSRKGSRFPPFTGTSPDGFLLRLNYVDITITGGWKDKQGGLILGAGLTIARLIDFAEYRQNTLVRYNENPYKPLDILFTASAGLPLKKTSRLHFMLAFQYSLNSIRFWMPPGSTVPWQKNKLIQIRAEYIL